MRQRLAWLVVVAIAVVGSGCSSSEEEPAASTTGGSAGSGAAGAGGSGAGAGGTATAGAGGTTAAGAGGTTAGAGGAQAGSGQGGAAAGKGGSDAGQAGSGQAGSEQAGTAGAGGSAGSGAGEGGAAGAAGNAGSAGAAGEFNPGGEVTTIDTMMGPFTVPSGGEGTKCIFRRLNNSQGAFVRRFRTTLKQGSHHMILYKSNKTEEQLEPKPCGGFSGLLEGDHAVFIAQQKNSVLTFPNDDDGTPVALEIAPDQMFRIEMHYFNTTEAPYDVTGDIQLDTIPLDSKVVKSDLAFWGTQNININPHSTHETKVKFQVALADTKTFALTTHQHHFGTRMRVWYGAGPIASEEGQLVADESNWSDPALQLFNPPLEFPKGEKKGFAYQCEWNNTSSEKVGFGESINDEMCFLWHYYYPSQGFQLCIDGFCPTNLALGSPRRVGGATRPG